MKCEHLSALLYAFVRVVPPLLSGCFGGMGPRGRPLRLLTEERFSGLVEGFRCLVGGGFRRFEAFAFAEVDSLKRLRWV